MERIIRDTTKMQSNIKMPNCTSEDRQMWSLTSNGSSTITILSMLRKYCWLGPHQAVLPLFYGAITSDPCWTIQMLFTLLQIREFLWISRVLTPEPSNYQSTQNSFSKFLMRIQRLLSKPVMKDTKDRKKNVSFSSIPLALSKDALW